MQTMFCDFCTDDSGAVTVDWVVLTAAIVGLGMIVLTPIAYQTDNTADQLAEYVTNVPVGYGN